MADGTETVDQIFQKATVRGLPYDPRHSRSEGDDGPVLEEGTNAPNRMKDKHYKGPRIALFRTTSWSPWFHPVPTW